MVLKESRFNGGSAMPVRSNLLIDLGKLYEKARKIEATQNIKESFENDPELMKMLENLGYLSVGEMTSQKKKHSAGEAKKKKQAK